MGQVTKLKRAWNLTLVFQIVQKISEKYYLWLYLSIDQVWWLNKQWCKRHSKMHPCTNADHDITDLVNRGVVKNTKTWISWEWNIHFEKLSFCSGGNLSRTWELSFHYSFINTVCKVMKIKTLQSYLTG